MRGVLEVFAQKGDNFSVDKGPEYRIMEGDAQDGSLLGAASVDLIITSPPYNVGINYGVWNDRLSPVDYMAFSARWLTACYHWLRDDGRLCVNVPIDRWRRDGSQSMSADMTRLATSLGFVYRAGIVWDKNYDNARPLPDGWRPTNDLPLYSTAEIILVFYKKYWRRRRPGVSDLTADEYTAWRQGIWRITPRERLGKHPAPFPAELPRRCLKLFSCVGDDVLDPFMGMGTTLGAALRLGRRATGIDLNPAYCQEADRLLAGLVRRMNGTARGD